MIDAIDMLLMLVVFALGGAIGYALAARGRSENTRAREELAAARRTCLEALFDQLQHLLWAIETELSPDRRTVLGDEREERVEAIIEQLRESDLFFRSKRFLIEEALVDKIEEALATSWRALGGFEIDTGGDADERAHALLTEAVQELESDLRQKLEAELQARKTPPPMSPEASAHGEPEPPARKPEERPGHRQVNLPAQAAPEEPPMAPPPTTMISLD